MSNLPITITRGYTTGRPLQGETRHCWICNAQIYVRLYRIKQGYGIFCRKCSSSFAAKKSNRFLIRLMQNRNILRQELSEFYLTKSKLDSQIKLQKQYIAAYENLIPIEVELRKENNAK